jgi:hypothetical protein
VTRLAKSKNDGPLPSVHTLNGLLGDGSLGKQ